MFGDQLCDGLGVPGLAQSSADFLWSEFLVAVTVEDGI